MNVSAFIGVRYLKARKAKHFLSLITLFSVLGVALGVATLITVLSVMDGFEAALKERLSRGEFHVLVTGKDSYFSADDAFLSSIFAASDEIVAVHPVLQTEAILRVGTKVAGMSVRGISESHMNVVADSLVESMSDKEKVLIGRDGLWLGKELAYRLNLLPGDRLTVISPTETEGPLESVPRMKQFVLEGIFDSGVPEKDAIVAFASMQTIQEFLQIKEEVNNIEIRVADFAASTKPAQRIREAIGGDYLVKDWEQLNSHLFSSLLLERIAMFVILAMIVLVASFNVVTSLSMTVIEKKKEIAILMAMGAAKRQIYRIFLTQGAVIGIVGTSLGFVLGISICVLLQSYPIIELPNVFYDRTLPVKITPLYVFMIVVTSLCLVLFAAYFPAKTATKLSPLEGFRNA